MHITVTGGTGFLGGRLIDRLLDANHQVLVVSRSAESVHRRWGDRVEALVRDTQEEFPKERLAGTECVIHLMGESLSAFRRTAKKRHRIYASRIETTTILVDALPESCHTFLCGSAIGIYPSSATARYMETTSLGEPETFLQMVCQAREREAQKATTPQRRVIHLRSSLVLGTKGIVPVLMHATKRRGGVLIGASQRSLSRIHVDDRVGGVVHAISHRSVQGPVNMVAPTVATYDRFVRLIAQHLHRPVRLRLPVRILRLVQGSAAELTTGDQKVLPTVLQETGYVFQYEDIGEAMRQVCAESVDRKPQA